MLRPCRACLAAHAFCLLIFILSHHHEKPDISPLVARRPLCSYPSRHSRYVAALHRVAQPHRDSTGHRMVTERGTRKSHRQQSYGVPDGHQPAHRPLSHCRHTYGIGPSPGPSDYALHRRWPHAAHRGLLAIGYGHTAHHGRTLHHQTHECHTGGGRRLYRHGHRHHLVVTRRHL